MWHSNTCSQNSRNILELLYWWAVLSSARDVGAAHSPSFPSQHWGSEWVTRFMRILQPQTESGPRNYVFMFFSFCFSCFFFLFHIILRSCEIIIYMFFHSPIMWKCHSHLFIVFPSCALDIIMFIRVPFLHVAIMYLSFSIENESKQNQKWKIYIYIYIKGEIKWKVKNNDSKTKKKTID